MDRSTVMGVELQLKHKWASTPDSMLSVLAAICYAVLVGPFVYRGVVGETDLSEMVAAILLGHSTGMGIAAGMHYNYAVSFGYYYAIYTLIPDAVLADSQRLMTVLNVAGWLSASGALLFLGLTLRRIFGAKVSFATTLLFAFSPMYLELGTSSHPMLPALMFLLIGHFAVTYAVDARTSPFGRFFAGTTAITFWGLTLCFREDFLFAFPFIALADSWSVGNEGRKKWYGFAIRLGCLCIALFVYWGIRRAVVGGAVDNATNIRSFFEMFYIPANALKGIVVLLLGTGLATIVGLFLVLVSDFYRDFRGDRLLLVLSLALPTLAFWLPNSTPVRHLLLAILAFSLFISMHLSKRSWRAIVAAVICLILGNQLLGELAYPVVASRYPWSYPAVGARRSTYSVPLGAFYWDHRSNQRTFDVLQKEGRAIATQCKGNLLVVADQPYYIIMAIAESDSSARVSTSYGPERDVWHIRGTRCNLVIVQKYKSWPKNVLPVFLTDPTYEGWPVYFQEITRGVPDSTQVPAERSFQLRDSAERRG